MVLAFCNIQVGCFPVLQVCGPMGEDVNKGECHGLSEGKGDTKGRQLLKAFGIWRQTRFMTSPINSSV